MSRRLASISIGWRHFWRQIRRVLHQPIFLTLTLTGNVTLLICATLFFFAEHGSNPQVTSWTDGLWWAFVTMTTVGYGDVVAVTGLGRIVSVSLMLTGGVLFLSFVGLLSSAFIELEFLELRAEVRQLRVLLESHGAYGRTHTTNVGTEQSPPAPNKVIEGQ